MDVVTEAKAWLNESRACNTQIEKNDIKRAGDIIKGLLSIVSRLPVTADGVRVVPGDTVYDLLGTARRVSWDAHGVWKGFWVTCSMSDNRGVPEPERSRREKIKNPCRVDACFSTRAAAEAAGGEA